MANTGKVFEEAIKKSIESVPDTYYYRLRDPASSFGDTSNNGLRFSITNDYDCLAYKHPVFYPLELKSDKGTSFSFQTEKGQSGKNIKLSQINGLLKASKVTGIKAGFLFNFSSIAKTYWLNIIDFYRFYQTTTKKSINEADIIEYGGILVQQTLKQVNYSYNISKLFSDINK